MFSIRLIKTTCTFIFFIICSVLVDSSCLYSDEPLSEQKIKDLLFLQNFDAVASIPHAADDYMRMYYSAAAYFSMAQRDWYKKDIREKHIENCIEKYKTVSEKSPDEDLKSRGLLWYGISLMLFRAKNLNFEQLSAPFLNLINIYPGSTYINDAYFYLGRICRAFNRHEKAHDYFTRLAGSDESDRVFNIYTKKLHLPGELAASYLNIKYIPKAPEPVKPAAALKEPEPPVEKKIESVPEKTEPLPAAAQPEKKTREDPAPVIVPEPEPPKPETEPVKPVPPPPAPEPPRVKKGKIIISGDKPQTLNVNNEPVNFNSEAEFTPGNYTIRASLAGCHDITLPAVIKDGETTSIELKFRKIILYGTLAVKSEPAGAVIFIDDKETGKTPWQQQKIETGEKLVRLEFTGQKPIIERVLIEPNQTKNLFYSFSPLPATLELTCNEKDTVLKITGSATNLSLTCGQSKITLELPGGEYKIESSKDGFLTAEKKLSIIQGKKYSDKITLEPSIRLAVQTEYSRSGTDKKSLNYPTALYIYKSTLYIIDASLNRMMAFTPDMKFLFNAGGNGSGINPSTKKKDGSGSGPQELNNPRGLAVFNNKIFITDNRNNRIQIFDLQGNNTGSFGKYGKEPGNFISPGGIDIDASGNIYITDSGNNRIQIFDQAGKFLAMFGSRGSKEGMFDEPSDIKTDSKEIFIADWANSRIQVFSITGEFLRSFGEKEGMTLPSYICLDQNSIYISDTKHSRVMRYRKNGTFQEIIQTGSGLSGPRGLFIEGSIMYIIGNPAKIIQYKIN